MIWLTWRAVPSKTCNPWMMLADGTGVDSNLQPLPFESIDIMGIPISYTDGRSLVAYIRTCVEEGKKGWICGINAQAVNLAFQFPWLRDFYRGSLANCCEGFGVTLAARFLGFRVPQRVIWAYWIHDLLAEMEQTGSTLFLLGGTEDVVTHAAHRLKTRYSNLRMTGQRNGYFGPKEQQSVVDAINKAKPDVLLVAMGMPKQEEWILHNIGNLDTKVVLPVGALLDYLSGVKSRCPKWMAAVGLEWLYRLFKEPGRMWRRYMIGNPLFIARIVSTRWQTITKKLSSPRAS